MSVAATTMGAVPLLGYLTGVQAAFRIIGESGMAVTTAISSSNGSVSGGRFATQLTMVSCESTINPR